MKDDKSFIADQSQWFGPLRRRPHVLVFNNTNVLNDTTVMTLRYGWTTWQDSCDPQPFSAGQQSLGFNSSYVNALPADGKNTFPSLAFNEVEDVGGWGPGPVRWKAPYAINGALTKLFGNHSVKIGADVRRMGVALATVCCFDNSLAGNFNFDASFTSNNGAGGHELASLLLGLPSSGQAPFNDGQGEWFTRYWGRVRPGRLARRTEDHTELRIAPRARRRPAGDRQPTDRRVRSERGQPSRRAGEQDRHVARGEDAARRIDLRGCQRRARLPGRSEEDQTCAARRRDLRHEHRYGGAWRLRTLLGAVELSRRRLRLHVDRLLAVDLAQSVVAGERSAKDDHGQPVPVGPAGADRSSLGLLTNVGGRVDFVDQTKGSPKVHRYSVDLQRQLPGAMAITIGYVGATGRDIGYGGTTDALININQVDPALARQLFPRGSGWDAAALRQSVPNPFFGIAAAGELGTTATIQRGQLLRPFPEFGDIMVHQTTAGSKRQYNALDVQLDKRIGGGGNWWGGRYSYTFSRMKDNQFGESSNYGSRLATPQNNYDLEAEYGVSNFDSPHRIVLAPIIQLPSPANATGAMRALASGWNISAVVEMVSGPPLNAVLSGDVSDANLGLFGGRQRPNLVGEPNSSGSDQDRAATDAHAAARWFNGAAYANPGVGTFGTAPRTNGDARWQFRKNIDFVLTKETRFGGSQVGEIRFEILNLTNTPKFGNFGTINAANLSSFGRVDIQAGFMRIWQLSFRYRF